MTNKEVTEPGKGSHSHGDEVNFLSLIVVRTSTAEEGQGFVSLVGNQWRGGGGERHWGEVV